MNNRGSATLLVIILSLLIGAAGFYIYDLIQNSKMQMYSAERAEARKKVADMVTAGFRSSYIVNYSLQNYNSVFQNGPLKDCILSGVPDTDCQSINLSFYRPTESGWEKFSGSSDKPLYLDKQGSSCVDASGNPTDSCMFSVVTDCIFECPPQEGGGACALTKVMSCNVVVSPYVTGLMASYNQFAKTKQYAGRYSVRLLNDLKTYKATQ